MKSLTRVLTIALALTTAYSIPLPEAVKSEKQNVTQSLKQVPNGRNLFPNHITPLYYHLILTPNFNDFTFDGELMFEFRTQVFANTIVLQAEDLDIPADGVRLESIVAGSIFELNINHNDDVLTVTVSTDMRPGLTYYLHINYRGDMREDGVGLYRDSYMVDFERRWYAATNFFPQHAKKVFPCMEQTYLPTLFKLEVLVPQTYSAISNTVADTSSASGRTRYEFETTQSPINNYRFNFVISRLEIISHNPSPTPVNIYGRFARSDNGNFAGITAQRAIEEFGEYTEISFGDIAPEIVIDVVAVPRRHDTLETLGLVSTWEPYVTYNNLRSSARSQQEVTLALTTQLSSQWWGNSVSENSYASAWIFKANQFLMGYLISNQMEGGMALMDQFNVDVLQAAFKLDSSTNSRPVANDEVQPNDAEEVINELTGPKGACVFRMLMHLMGEDQFQGAHRLLLSRNGQTMSDLDVYIAFQEQIAIDNIFEDYPELILMDFMDDWVLQPGYPLVTVELDGMSNAVATQERFFSDRGAASGETYQVPLTWTRRSENRFDELRPRMILRDDPEVLENSLVDVNEWIIVNLQQSGFYRVNYDEQLWERITEVMRDPDSREIIHTLNRAQLMDDSLALARAGRTSFDVALDLAESLEFENEYVVWASVLDDFKYLIISASADTLQADRLRGFLRVHAAEFLERIEYDVTGGGNHVDFLTRALLMEIACDYNDRQCVNAALEQFDDINGINANIRPAVYCTAVRNMGEEAFDILLDQYNMEQLHSEQLMILRALGCTRDPGLIMRYLEMTVSEDSPIPNDDRIVAFDAILDEFGENVDIALEFLMDNGNNIIPNYGGFHNAVAVMRSLIEHVFTNDQIAEIESIMWNSDLRDAMPDNGLILARANVQWGQENMEDVQAWLIANGYNSSGIASYSISLVGSLLIALFLWRH